MAKSSFKWKVKNPNYRKHGKDGEEKRERILEPLPRETPVKCIFFQKGRRRISPSAGTSASFAKGIVRTAGKYRASAARPAMPPNLLNLISARSKAGTNARPNIKIAQIRHNQSPMALSKAQKKNMHTKQPNK
jgi:hypothetical protein